MQALILAAGRGSRLGPSTNGTPKCLLEIGRRPIVEHQLETLSEAGVGPVAMVVGYCADEIREEVGIRAECIENSRWKVTNSLYSFLLAREWVSEGLVILNCDILFHPEILDRLLEAGGDAIAYDSSSGNGREHMKVRVTGGRLIDMSKDVPADESAGENVGALCLSAEGAQALFDKAEEIIAAGREKEWLGAAVREIMQERTFRAVDMAGLPWAEIDFPYDLDRARKEVWPAIQRSSWKRTVRWRSTRWLVAGLLLLALSLLIAWVSFRPAEVTWVSGEIVGAQKVSIRAGDRSQGWWLLERDQQIEARVFGPGTVRIDSRLWLSESASAATPYILDVVLDGERLDWFKETAVPSKSWQHEQGAVSKRSRIELEVSPGTHILRIGFLAPEAAQRCIVRVRHLELPEVEEP